MPAPGSSIRAVHCRIGSSEIEGEAGQRVGQVHCRIGSSEKIRNAVDRLGIEHQAAQNARLRLGARWELAVFTHLRPLVVRGGICRKEPSRSSPLSPASPGRRTGICRCVQTGNRCPPRTRSTGKTTPDHPQPLSPAARLCARRAHALRSSPIATAPAALCRWLLWQKANVERLAEQAMQPRSCRSSCRTGKAERRLQARRVPSAAEKRTKKR